VKRFHCHCGEQLYFDNHRCLSCGDDVGFDPGAAAMVPLANRQDLVYCDNWPTHGVCNWLLPKTGAHELCFACCFNRTIPNLELPENTRHWAALERAKKRLLYTLMGLGLPLLNGWQNPDQGLLFDFLDDARTQPGHYPESFVASGFGAGVITINVMEADDVARTALQAQLRERYRTLLGHFRHESGHYYWSLLPDQDAARSEFLGVFGDETLDYKTALDRHYAAGPPEDWHDDFISAYASSHPSEDWAETWGHYLHIHDALETAVAHDLLPGDTLARPFSERVAAWQSLSVALNELNRSVGQEDVYPFVISAPVCTKLDFVDRVMDRLRTHC